MMMMLVQFVAEWREEAAEKLRSLIVKTCDG
jgi:hypothetical protein